MMERGAPRKYLPAEGYRFLTLLMLAWKAEEGASKGELAWETRANHYMATRVVRALAEEHLIELEGGPDAGYLIRISPAGTRFLTEHRAYMLQTFGALLREHFRFGLRPDWARGLAD